MTATRQKKSKKLRAKTTHGYGSKKKHRGAGNRGGRGMAGTGKRADQKKQTILKKYGNACFVKKELKLKKKKVNSINLYELDTLIENKQIKKEKDIYIINLTKLKYTKLLGSGKIFNKYEITIISFLKKAKEKIEKLGGKINVPI